MGGSESGVKKLTGGEVFLEVPFLSQLHSSCNSSLSSASSLRVRAGKDILYQYCIDGTGSEDLRPDIVCEFGYISRVA